MEGGHGWQILCRNPDPGALPGEGTNQRDYSRAEGDMGKASCWKPAPSVSTEEAAGSGL